ncbi:MAG: FAD-binding oxidoreductase [Halobacteriovoraceae bacterium]|nr:FAD-binding oxidoreductase [Halobacteriovoraceae bacterium]
MDIKQFNGENVTKFDPIDSFELYPESIQELQNCLKIAIEKKICLFPISTGRNWGLGSKLPPDNKSVILNLSKLNEIYDYDESKGVIVVGPGVTQDQISKFLIQKKSDFFLDVTASSKDTSLIGNTLERGISYNCLRVKNVLGIELIDGQNRILKTGQWRFENSKSKYCYPYGIGPDLSGLFFQSNFGIIIKMVYKLKRKSKYSCSVQLKFDTIENVAKSLPTINELLESKIFDNILHIANKERALISIKPEIIKNSQNDTNLANKAMQDLGKLLDKEWIGTNSLFAYDKNSLKYQKKIIKNQLSQFAKVEFVDIPFQEKIIRILKFLGLKSIALVAKSAVPFRDLYNGTPTDSALGCVINQNRFNTFVELSKYVDSENVGFIYTLPITHLSEKNCIEIVQTTEEISEKHFFNPSITLNIVDVNCLEAVISIEFDISKRNEAHRCIDEIENTLISKGHYPYRTNIKKMGNFPENEQYVEVLKDLKLIFDPNNIIAPNKYGI